MVMVVVRHSETGVLQACKQAGLRCVRLSQLADAFRELGGAPCLLAHIPQIREERLELRPRRPHKSS